METPVIILDKDDKVCADSYEPPTIEVLEITLEKGFADSAPEWEEGTW